MNAKDLKQLILNPSDHFKSPEDILKNKTLSRDDKIAILRSWAEEENEKAVAVEENMGDNDSDLLDRIRKAMHDLDYYPDPNKAAPTKQGDS